MTKWLTSREFAAAAGVTERVARKILGRCHAGGHWRGQRLDVAISAGHRGGRSGIAYMIASESIPFQPLAETPVEKGPFTVADALARRTTHSASHGIDTASPASNIQQDDQLDFKLAAVQAARRGSIIEVARSLRWPADTARAGELVGESTIRRWVAAYEQCGMAGLARKAPTNAGRRRVSVSREWDDLADRCGIERERQEEVAAELSRRIRSLWASAIGGWKAVQFDAQPDLIELTIKAGCDLPIAELLAICKVPRAMIEAERIAGQAVAIYRKDAGRSAAIQKPRIRRLRDCRPGEWVAADVHHIDVLLCRDDGSLCTAKGVYFVDLATNRIFCRAFMMPPGEMIRREHVVETFIAMCEDPSWGPPTHLYVDRGGEFNWGEFLDDLFQLKARLKRDINVRDQRDLEPELRVEPGMIRARAYNPQAKIIESIFAVLEKGAYRHISGWIGGDRFRKKTQNQGKEPIPFNGSFEDFGAELGKCHTWYHNKPQDGHLAGKSPFDAFRLHLANGWTSVTIDRGEFGLVFAKPETRHVRAGGCFSLYGVIYRADELIPLAGVGTITVMVPLFRGYEYVHILKDDGRTWFCRALPQNAYRIGDPAGAGESARQAKLLTESIRAIEATFPKRDPAAVVDRVNAIHPPAPIGTSSAVVSIGPNHQAAARAAMVSPRQVAAEAAQKQLERMDLLRSIAHAAKR